MLWGESRLRPATEGLTAVGVELHNQGLQPQADSAQRKTWRESQLRGPWVGLTFLLLLQTWCVCGTHSRFPRCIWGLTFLLLLQAWCVYVRAYYTLSIPKMHLRVQKEERLLSHPEVSHSPTCCRP